MKREKLIKELNEKIDNVNKLFDEGEGYILLETKKNNSNIRTEIKGDTKGITYCLTSLFDKLIKNDIIPFEIITALLLSTELEKEPKN